MGLSLNRRSIGIAAAVLALALPAAASAVSSPIAIGPSNTGLPYQAAVAVDGTGTAYIAWEAPSAAQLDFCKVAVGATGCTPVALPVATGGVFFDPPSVLLSGGDVYVYEDVLGLPGSSNQEGVDEYISTNGGSSFSLYQYAVASIDDQSMNPVILLPNGTIGVGGEGSDGNPAFQANPTGPTDPTNYSEDAPTPPPYAALDPPRGRHLDGQL